MSDPALAESVPGRGRMYRYPPTGELYPSVTSIIDVIDKPALQGWAAKETAKAAFRNRDALLAMEDEDAAVDMLKNARFRSGDKRKRLGTSVHEIAEALATNTRLPTFTHEEAPYADSFMQFVSDYDPTFLVAEGTVFNTDVGYAGTFDALALIGEPTATVLVDWKSGSGIYPEVALQLSALRHATELWDSETGELRPMPAVAGTLAVWLQPDRYAVYAVDAGEKAFAAFRGALGVWPWEKGGDKEGVIGASMSPQRLAVALGGPKVAVAS